MKVSKIILPKKDCLPRLIDRGFFSDDPQFLFNAMMVFDSGRDFTLDGTRHDLEKIENFLVSEEIPYTRLLIKLTLN